MKKIGRKLILILTLCFCLGATVFAAQANAAGKVKNATVKKSGKYYIGYKKSGKKIRNKWGIVKKGSKTYTYYFDNKGRAYTGVRAIGKTPQDTKLYYFTAKGRLKQSKTKRLQDLSKPGKKYSVLKEYISKIDKKVICSLAEGCGIDPYQYNNGFTIYVNQDKQIEYVSVDQN